MEALTTGMTRPPSNGYDYIDVKKMTKHNETEKEWSIFTGVYSYFCFNTTIYTGQVKYNGSNIGTIYDQTLIGLVTNESLNCNLFHSPPLKFQSVDLGARIFSIVPQKPPKYQRCIMSHLPKYSLLLSSSLTTWIFYIPWTSLTQTPILPETINQILIQEPTFFLSEYGQIPPLMQKLTI